MYCNYNYIKIIDDDEWGLLKIVPSVSSVDHIINIPGEDLFPLPKISMFPVESSSNFLTSETLLEHDTTISQLNTNCLDESKQNVNQLESDEFLLEKDIPSFKINKILENFKDYPEDFLSSEILSEQDSIPFLQNESQLESIDESLPETSMFPVENSSNFLPSEPQLGGDYIPFLPGDISIPKNNKILENLNDFPINISKRFLEKTETFLLPKILEKTEKTKSPKFAQLDKQNFINGFVR